MVHGCEELNCEKYPEGTFRQKNALKGQAGFPFYSSINTRNTLASWSGMSSGQLVPLGRGGSPQGASSGAGGLHQPSFGPTSSRLIPEPREAPARARGQGLPRGPSPERDLPAPRGLPRAPLGAWLSPGPGRQAGMWVSRFFPRCFSGIPDRAHQSCLLSALHALVSLS